MARLAEQFEQQRLFDEQQGGRRRLERQLRWDQQQRAEQPGDPNGEQDEVDLDHRQPAEEGGAAAIAAQGGLHGARAPDAEAAQPPQQQQPDGLEAGRFPGFQPVAGGAGAGTPNLQGQPAAPQPAGNEVQAAEQGPAGAAGFALEDFNPAAAELGAGGFRPPGGVGLQLPQHPGGFLMAPQQQVGSIAVRWP